MSASADGLSTNETSLANTSNILIGYRLGFDFLVTVALVIGVRESLTYPGISGYFPLTMSVFGLALATANLAVDVVRVVRKSDSLIKEVETLDSSLALVGSEGMWLLRRFLYFWGAWFVGTAVLTYFIGMIPACLVFMIAFLRIEAKWKWPKNIFASVLTIAIFWYLGQILAMRWPPHLIPVMRWLGI